MRLPGIGGEKTLVCMYIYIYISCGRYERKVLEDVVSLHPGPLLHGCMQYRAES